MSGPIDLCMSAARAYKLQPNVKLSFIVNERARYMTIRANSPRARCEYESTTVPTTEYDAHVLIGKALPFLHDYFLNNTGVGILVAPVKEADPLGKDPRTPGAKLDAGKLRPSLVLGGFARALKAVTAVGTYGAVKYSDNGWMEVPNGVERYDDAKLRHWLDEKSGTPQDKDTGLLHAAHEAWNALARLDLLLRENERVSNRDRIDTGNPVGGDDLGAGRAKQVAAVREYVADLEGHGVDGEEQLDDQKERRIGFRVEQRTEYQQAVDRCQSRSGEQSHSSAGAGEKTVCRDAGSADWGA